MSYVELLKDPRWQRKRLEVLERDGWKCTRCTRTELTLHVHHKRYRKGAKPWEYEDSDLVTLCVECHEDISAARKLVDEALVELDHYDLHLVLGYIEGLTFFRRDEEVQKAPNIRSAEHASGFGQALNLSSHEGYCIFARHNVTVAYVRQIARIASERSRAQSSNLWDLFPIRDQSRE